MANVKEVEIWGFLPFDCYETEELKPYLAVTNTPVFGLSFSWGESRQEPNEKGGETLLFQFLLHGKEAVSFKWIDSFKSAVEKAHGSIVRSKIKDLEK